MERGLIEMEWGTTAFKYSDCVQMLQLDQVQRTTVLNSGGKLCGTSFGCHHVFSNRCSSPEKRENIELNTANQNQSWCCIIVVYSPFKSFFQLCWTCWRATNLYKQPVTTLWKEGPIKSLITAHHLENNWCSEVWRKHWASWQTAWKKREICEYVCMCWWLLNTSLRTPRSKHTLPHSEAIIQLSIAAGYWTWQGRNNPPK